ncbi:MAG: hypothetical protein KDE53_39385, partial [Caldilineaceae bacterium]|nr:hypothetical protein [Caldilineaceae bacterium]
MTDITRAVVKFCLNTVNSSLNLASDPLRGDRRFALVRRYACNTKVKSLSTKPNQREIKDRLVQGWIITRARQKPAIPTAQQADAPRLVLR